MNHRIRGIRNQKKMSGTTVAQLLDISPQYYYDIEKGKRNLSANIASQLAEVFNISVDYLLGRTDDPTPPNAEEPTERELEELIKENPLVFNGVPLNDEDKQDILDVMRVAWKTIQKRKQK